MRTALGLSLVIAGVGCAEPWPPAEQPVERDPCLDPQRVHLVRTVQPSPAIPVVTAPSYFGAVMHLTVGGTVNTHLECQGSSGPVPFDQPVTATTDADSPISVTQNNDQLTFVGVREGISTVDLLSPDGTSYASFRVSAAYIAGVLPVMAAHDVLPPGNVDLAFAAQYDTRAEARLLNDADLIDDEMVIVPPPGGVVAGGSSWPYYFTFDKAVLGDSTISVTSGGNTYSAPFVHLETADTIKPITPPGTSHCYAAMNGTRFVQGLTWTYVLEGSVVAASHTNCVSVYPSDDTNGDNQVTVAITAGGAILRVTIRMPLT